MSWCDNPEEGALNQAKNLANLPFAFQHVSLMPDTHQGYGMPIGGVLATEGVIIPNAVGVDIGCGMCAVKTALTEIDTETLKKILGDIRKEIPVGRNHNKEAQEEKWMPNIGEFFGITNSVVLKEYNSAMKQVGTLGGGNHFIEIQKGDDGHIWVMIHSGSRNIGLKVAEYYNELAYDLNKKWHSETFLPKNKKDSLAFLPVDSIEGQDYIREMQYCVDFALSNRKLMMEKVINIVNKYTDMQWFDPAINIAHNYAKLEHHMGRNVWVHRKGATLAEEGTIGIIPGSQGSSSYIVKGKGEVMSFKSCSHGAGRKIGRKMAQKILNLEEEVRLLDEKGILHAIRGISDLDEAPGSYKEIETVMLEQQDLVEIITKLTPLAVVKG